MSTAEHLAANLRQLRKERRLTQQQLAERADMPRATWSNLESGGANPTLSVLQAAAEALAVSIEELLAPPRATAKHYRPDELPAKQRTGVKVRHLLPDPLPGLQLERMELPPGRHMVGVPHTPGTREYLTCESGRVELVASGERYLLEPGDVVVFRGDQKHSYVNRDARVAVAYSAVVLTEG